MAECIVVTEPTYRIAIHGNNGFKSAHLLDQMNQDENNMDKLEKFELLLFSDLNLNRQYSQVEPSEEMLELIEQSENGLEISAVLVLISLTEIFSGGMHKIILKLPYNKFYGFNQKNEKEWWKYVIVVFTFGDFEDKLESKVRESISKNGGVKDIVRKAGNRCICISNKTPLDELIKILEDKIQLLDGKLIVAEDYSARSQEKVNSSLPEQNDVIQIKEKEDNGIKRRFAIIGESKSGKSTLENLLLGPRKSQLFDTKSYSKPLVKANNSPIGEVRICKMFVGENKCTCWSNENFRMEIVDDPNCIKQEKHEQFLENCVNQKGNPERITFLILIDLHSSCFSEKEYIKIMNSEDILLKLKFELFTDAIVVFTHVDELVRHSKETPEQILNKKLQQKVYVHLKTLLDLVHQRHIFINTMNFSRINRNEILNKLFEFDEWDSDSIVKIIDKIRDLNTAYNVSIRIFSDITEEEREEEIYQEVRKLGNKMSEGIEQENNVDSCQYTCIVLKRNEKNCEDLINIIPLQTPEGNSGQQYHNDPNEQRSCIKIEQITEALKELSTTSKIPIKIFSDETEDKSEKKIYHKIFKLSKVLLKGPPMQDDLDDSWTYVCVILTKSNKYLRF